MQVRMMKEDRAVAEGALEEARCREVEQRSRADSLGQELEVQRTHVQRHLTQVSALPSPLPCPLPFPSLSLFPSLPSPLPCPLPFPFPLPFPSLSAFLPPSLSLFPSLPSPLPWPLPSAADSALPPFPSHSRSSLGPAA